MMKRLLVVAAIFALTLLIFARPAFTDLILARGDTYQYFYPYWAARDSALRAGTLPLWTPHLFMGVPLLANPQVGALYPPNWLTLPFSAPVAVKVSILLHVVWAYLGAYLAARRIVLIDRLPALLAGAVFALGGYLGAHVEQINQLQGLAWMPWAFLTFEYTWRRPLVYLPAFGAVMALQVLSGHTQTVFITGIGLLAYTVMNVIADLRTVSFLATDDWRAKLTDRLAKGVFSLLAGVLLAALLSLAQLWPTLELTGISNRGGGFNAQQAVAFSWSPAIIGRGILPSYDAQIFGEYIAYIGVFALCLGLVGVFSKELGRHRVIWFVLALIGIFLALGAYNPIYWMLAELPGFNLFRVPARWLALFALGAAMLAGMGAHMLLASKRYEGEYGSLAAISVIVGVFALAAALFSGSMAAEIDGPAAPTLLTWAAWVAAFIMFVNVVLLRPNIPRGALAVILTAVTLGELFFAARIMPYNDLVDAAAYHDKRFTAYQLLAMQAMEPAPHGRVLSISKGLFDTGDKDALTARNTARGISERGARYTFTAAKLKELAAPNLPLIWGVPTVDGFDGGVLPTTHYTQFTSLLLPPDTPRTIDGRLREILALESCGGACIPDSRWLALMNVRWLVLDKTFDVWHEGVAFDTAFKPALTADAPLHVALPDFVADRVQVLYDAARPPALTVEDAALTAESVRALDSGAQWAEYVLDAPRALESLDVSGAGALIALTLVDSRTGDFQQVPLQGWRLILSSDIKLYENSTVLPRAFVVNDAVRLPDTWQGSEDALALMAAPEFDPAMQAVIHTDSPDAVPNNSPAAQRESAQGSARITAYTPTLIEIAVDAPQGGTLILTDAYYEGWQASVNGEAAPLHRANVMFRAVDVPAGESIVIFTYHPAWYPVGLIVSGVGWLILGIVTLARARANQRLSEVK